MMTAIAGSTSVPANASAGHHQSSWRLRVRRLLAGLNSRAERLPKPLRLVLRPVSVVLEGISIGILRTADVDSMVCTTYESQPRFYDPRRYRLRYEERVLPALKELASGRNRLLDAFCGQGREAELFSRNGFEVTAIDRLGWMIESARDYAVEAGFAAKFLAEDFASFQGQTFDIVYTSCWMYSTCQTSQRRQVFLSKCSELCTDNGLIVISWVSDAADSRIAIAARFLAARLAAILTAGNVGVEWGERIYSGLFWHHLSDETVVRELELSGLTAIRVIPGCPPEPTFCILQCQPAPERAA